MANSETSICNMAISLVEGKRINDLDSDTTVEAINCRLHYEPTRDALLRSYRWPFAAARAELSEDTNSPDFEYDYQFGLPNDYLAMRSIYEDRYSDENLRNYAIEGDLLLTNEDEMSIRYIKKVTDVSKFDPLFVKLLAASIADELVGPITGGQKRIQDKITLRLKVLTAKAATLSRQETNTEGQYSLETWNDARYD